MLHILISAALLLLPAAAIAADEPSEISFGIIATESSDGLRLRYDPFIAEMERRIGIRVRPFFAPDYAGVVQAMRFGKVQVARYGNKSAAEAVDRADAEVAFRALNPDGTTGYHSVVVVHRDSPIRSIDDLLRDGARYSFGNGDPNSTSGFLVPGYYLFALNRIEPRTLFKRVINANHETNALAVVTRQLDAATNNDAALVRLQRSAPDKWAQLRVIWTSPLIPNDPIVWRRDLPDATKQRLSSFFLEFGQKGSPDQIARDRAILEALRWDRLVASSNAQLIPTRQLDLFTARLKIEGDSGLSDAERRVKLGEIDARLAALAEEARRAAGS